jgi:methylmalonyl-CoA mutase N-terminal domain/subunit
VEGTVIDFVQKQIDASERLFNMMLEDHKERMVGVKVWVDMNESYQKKLAERDEEIRNLKKKLELYEQTEKL